MEVVPGPVAARARAWAEQHDDLVSASRQIDRARTGGFSTDVADAAARFTAAWTGHAEGLCSDCGTSAAALQAALADYVATDLGVRGLLTGAR